MLKQPPKNLPDSPGVYKMLNEEGRVIYIGKAKNLKKRVKQYFRKGYKHSTRTQKLLDNLAKIETISVDKEIEAMILESNLIKQLQPKYNILLKDDKSYVYIKITNEDFPRIQIVRQVQKDGAKYIGPKTAQHKVKTTLKLLKKLFPFRHCNLDIKNIDQTLENEKKRVKVTRKTIKYPCLDFFIKRCSAPCIGKIDPESYAKIIQKVERFLVGKGEETLSDLEKEMKLLAKNKKFEKAIKLRDKIEKVKDILETQKVAKPTDENKDIINYCILHNQVYFNLFQIRGGKLLNSENFTLTAKEVSENENNEILSAFLRQYYEIATDIPSEILIPHKFEDKKDLEELISEEKGAKVKFIIPKIGQKVRLLEMSAKNAQIYADRNKPSWKKESDNSLQTIESLKEILNLDKTPKRIECYDISHLSGTNTVASMVVFEKGAPNKKMYRKFQLRTIEDRKPDDFKSMEEVLTRRLRYLAKEFKFKDHKLKKSTKKDLETIKELTNLESLENFYSLKKGDELIAFGQITEINEKISLINYNSPNFKLIEELIKKSKGKRIYFSAKDEERDFYLQYGFEELKKTPAALEQAQRREETMLVYDKIKQKKDPSFSKIPDLIIVDGGKGQLTQATKVIDKYQLDIPYISLAKRFEEIFTPHSKTPIILERNNPALQLVQRLRDEAHRFAITFQRSKRKF
jgi:excinuclease ABC subunit C